MSRNPLLIALLFFILLLPGLQERSADRTVPIDSAVGPPGRTMVDRSSYTFNTSDGSWIGYSEDIITPTGHYVEIDDHKMVMAGSVKASYNSIYRASNWRSIQEYQGMVYLSFVTVEGSLLVFHLGRSTDKGSNWQTIEVGNVTNADSGFAELIINEDKLFYLMNCDEGTGQPKTIDMKVTPCYNWMNLSSVGSIRIVTSMIKLESSMTAMPGRTTVFYKNTGYDWLKYTGYDGGWSTEKTIAFKVNTFHAAYLGNATHGSLNLFTVSRTDRTELGSIGSIDKGETWGTYKMLYQSTAGILFMAGSPNGDHTDIAFNHVMSNDIEYARGFPGILKDLVTVASSGNNMLDPTPNELAISSEGNEVAIAHEDSNGRVLLIRSRDHGRNFTTGVQVGGGDVHCASMSADMDFLLVIEGADLSIYGFVPSSDAMMRSKVLAFPALSSWDGLYFQAGGVSEVGALGFRILSPDSGTVYFPADGWEDMFGSGPASLNDREYNHFVLMNITSDSVPDIRKGIVIEIRMNRIDGSSPTIFSHAIDFSIGYPYREDFSVPENIIEVKGCTVSASGVTLSAGNSTGYCIFGPIIRETPGPDHLSTYCRFIAGGAAVSFSIKDMKGLDIEGFNGPMVKSISEQDKEVYVKWGVNNLGNLPKEIVSFYVRIDLQKGQTFSPRVIWVEFKPSAVPVVDGIVLEKAEIYRGNDMSIRILISDKEEPAKDLDPSIEVMDPLTGSWTDSIVSDPIWNGSSWISLFHPGTDVHTGLYRIRVTAMDGLGRVGGPVEMEEGILVKNNLPTPPMLSIFPDRLVNGSALRISTLFLGSDIETDRDDLRYNVTIRVNGALRGAQDDMMIPEMNITSLELRKGDAVRIEARTWDGEDQGDATVTDAVVQNSPLMVDPGFKKIVMDEDIALDLDVGSYFSDADPESLTYTYDHPDIFSLQEKGPGVIELKGEENFNGRSFLSIEATDGTASAGVNVTIEIRPVNDPPSWAIPGPIIANEGEWVLIPIGASDDSDPEPVLVTSNLADLPGMVSGVNLIRNPNGSCMLRPTNQMVGTHRIDVNVSDSQYKFNYSFTFVVNNLNTPPSIPNVTIIKGLWTVFSNERIGLTATSSDEDLIWGDILNYTWTSSIQGAIGYGSVLEPKLIAGAHRIFVNVTDSHGLKNSTVVTLTVLDPADSEKSVVRTWIMYVFAMVLGMILAVCAIVLFFLLTRKKKQVPLEKSPDEKRKEQEALKSPGEAMCKELPPGPDAKTQEKPPEKPPEKPQESPQSNLDPAQPSKPVQQIQKTDVTKVSEGKL